MCRCGLQCWSIRVQQAHGIATTRVLGVHPRPNLMDVSSARWLEPQLDDLTPQAVVSIASAYATLTGHQRATKLFDAVAAVVAARLDEFSVAELGQLAMAFARASFSDRSYTLFAPQEEALPEGGIASASELEKA